MRSDYFKNLDKQEVYNITDGLSVFLHEISLKRLGLNWNTLDTNISNDILEIIDECIEQLHENLNEQLKEYEDGEKE